MENSNSIGAVIVTYNRSKALVKCLEAVVSQTVLPDEVLIVDNRSTDDTPQVLMQNGYVTTNDYTAGEAGDVFRSEYRSGDKIIPIRYIRKYVNDGGAGGFYVGTREAYESGHSWIWMMDDDGVPENTQVAELLDKSGRYDIWFANALVRRIDNEEMLAFGLGTEYKKVSDTGDTEIIRGLINPFNGTFINRKVIDRIGFVKKEMFIWGDEVEFVLRAMRADIEPCTVCTAIHNHPKSKSNQLNVFPFFSKKKLPVPPARLSRYFYRNRGYINRTYFKPKNHLKTIGAYTILFSWRLRFGELLKFYKYYYKGCRNDYSDR